MPPAASPAAKVTECCSAIATSKYCLGNFSANSRIPEPSRIAGVMAQNLLSFFALSQRKRPNTEAKVSRFVEETPSSRLNLGTPWYLVGSFSAGS